MISNIFYLNEQGQRKNIEDNIYPLPNSAEESDRLFIVCDGVGGLSKGEEASRITCESISEYLLRENKKNISQEDIELALKYNFQQMENYTALYPDAEQMSTTLTLAYFNDSTIIVAWCGDSRIYHIRNGKVLWQSKDHSLVQQLVDSGEIPAEDANHHPKKNIILRSLNATNNNSKTDFYSIDDFQKGDYILLCTDGILENIDGDAIYDVFGLHQKEANKKQLFLDYCEGKTSDNFSMYLLQLDKTITPKSGIKLNKLLTIFLIIFIIATVVFFSFKYLKNTEPSLKNIRKEKVDSLNPQLKTRKEYRSDTKIINDLDKNVISIQKKKTDKAVEKKIKVKEDFQSKITEVKKDVTKDVTLEPIKSSLDEKNAKKTTSTESIMVPDILKK